MRVVLGISAVLVVFFMVILSWANSLPNQHNHQATVTIEAPVDVVFSAMTDWKSQPDWRDEIESIEIIDDTNFIEHQVNGQSVSFEVVALEENSLISLEMSGPFEGQYEAILSFDNGVTTVQINESITQNGLFGRILIEFYFDLSSFVDVYFNQLKIHLAK